MKGPRWLPLLGLAAALMLTACGVPPSDVIEAGAPASGLFDADSKPAVPVVIFLYFVDDGDPAAYPRTIGAPADLRTVLDELFDGPTAEEARTATTELPRLSGTADATVHSGTEVSVELPNDVTPLSHPAMLQLVCTVASMSEGFADASRDGVFATQVTVHVFGNGWMKSQSDDACPDAPQT
ncbi:hypothetical protein AB0G55_06275 [Streptomyces toyocaensis]|uniref:hypothetical protein n=1 Tax=Streptomyces toyocaensis TaxID=55952 RepID=UPI0034014AF6